jgi:hypothetical protein
MSRKNLGTGAQREEVKGRLTQIDPDRFNLHSDDPQSGFLPTQSLLLSALLPADHLIIAIRLKNPSIRLNPVDDN